MNLHASTTCISGIMYHVMERGGGGGDSFLHSAASERYRCKDSGVSNTALSSLLSSSWKRNSSPSR